MSKPRSSSTLMRVFPFMIRPHVLPNDSSIPLYPLNDFARGTCLDKLGHQQFQGLPAALLLIT
jgi:hypothetical protein